MGAISSWRGCGAVAGGVTAAAVARALPRSARRPSPTQWCRGSTPLLLAPFLPLPSELEMVGRDRTERHQDVEKGIALHWGLMEGVEDRQFVMAEAAMVVVSP